ncbi:MAG: T9SS type A sorting domain-containing protein [Phaeodactylibacter sp.]|nr:T9SS type A sorting domain-containing protein [Phaeodactylibacter sp.]
MKELPPEVAGELFETLPAFSSGEAPGGPAVLSARPERHFAPWPAGKLDGNPPEDYRVIAEYRKIWDNGQADWVHADSVEYTYDERNNMLERLTRGWDGTLWVRSWREVNTYNADNQRTSSTDERWDGAGWDHENGDRQILIEYNEDGNITLFHRRTWQDGEWLDWYKYVLAYDPITGNLASETFLFSPSMPGNLENDYRTLFTAYDSEGNALLLIGQSWENGEWVTMERQSREYDDDGRLILQLFQVPDGQNWIDNSRIIYDYNSEGLITSQTGQYWEADAQSWAFEYRIEYEYNNNGDLTLFVYSHWDEDTASWLGDYRYINEYDANFNLTLRWYQYWNHYVGFWENSERYIYTPDANGNTSTREYHSWSVDENTWQKRYHITYYYEVFVGTEEISIDPSAVAISPNPGSGLFRIQLDAEAFPGAEVEISAFNLTGQPARSLWVARAGNTLDLDLSGLAGGTYILQIRQDGRVAVKKVVVVK